MPLLFDFDRWATRKVLARHRRVGRLRSRRLRGRRAGWARSWSTTSGRTSDGGLGLHRARRVAGDPDERSPPRGAGAGVGDARWDAVDAWLDLTDAGWRAAGGAHRRAGRCSPIVVNTDAAPVPLRAVLLTDAALAGDLDRAVAPTESSEPGSAKRRSSRSGSSAGCIRDSSGGDRGRPALHRPFGSTRLGQARRPAPLSQADGPRRRRLPEILLVARSVDVEPATSSRSASPLHLASAAASTPPGWTCSSGRPVRDRFAGTIDFLDARRDRASRRRLSRLERRRGSHSEHRLDAVATAPLTTMRRPRPARWIELLIEELGDCSARRSPGSVDWPGGS